MFLELNVPEISAFALLYLNKHMLTSCSQDKKSKCDFFDHNWTASTATPPLTPFPAGGVIGLANPNHLAPPGAIQPIVPVAGPMLAPGAGAADDEDDDEEMDEEENEDEEIGVREEEEEEMGVGEDAGVEDGREELASLRHFLANLNSEFPFPGYMRGI